MVPADLMVLSVPRSDILDSRLQFFSAAYFRPCDLSRDLTSSAHFHEYKCTQMRQLGLYVGYGLYEGLISERHLRLIRYLKVFNMLLLGVRGEPPSSHDLDAAQAVVEFFVSEYMRLLALPLKEGEVISVPYCIHLALHIVRYVRNLNVSYAKLSAFGYENFLDELVPKLRTTNNLLQQIVNRQERRDRFVLNRNPDDTIMRDEEGNPVFGWGGWKGNSKISDCNQFCFTEGGKYPAFKFKNISISTRFADSWVLVCSNPSDQSTFQNPHIFRCTQIVTAGAGRTLDYKSALDISNIFLRGYFYPSKRDLYTDPFPSSLKFEYAFSNTTSGQVAEIPVEAIMFKLYVYPRFSTLPLQILTRDHLGKDYQNVLEWIGVALRH
jgi:hypothetical protein